MTKTKIENNSIDDLFNDKNIPESNWFKFKKVGDRIGGSLLGHKDKPAKDGFPAQRVYELKDIEGKIWNVPINLNRDYVIGRVNTAKDGDYLGFVFKKEIPATTKGHHPAKSIEVYVKHVEQPAETVDQGEIDPDKISY